MREMQPRKCDASHAQSPFISRLCARCNSSRRTTKARRGTFISRLCARCNRNIREEHKTVLLSFPAYARDATQENENHILLQTFHFPLMREMQLRGLLWWLRSFTFISRLCARCNFSPLTFLSVRVTFISRLCARCNKSTRSFRILELWLSFPAYARDATFLERQVKTNALLSFPAYARDATLRLSVAVAETMPFISRLCARCNSSQKRR